MTQSNDQNVPKWLGPLLIVGSILMALYGKPSQGVPHWIGYVASLAFTLAGLSLMAIAFGHPEYNNTIGPMIILVMAVIPTWIAFGPGERHCSGGFSFAGFGVHGQARTSDLSCRIVFGIGAVMIWGMFLAGIYQLVKGKKGT